MKSIRRQLTLSLLVGFSLLLGAGGAAIYFSTRTTLLREFDEALRSRALSMAGGVHMEGKKPVGKKPEMEFSENNNREQGETNLLEFYQAWIVGGPVLRKSRSLGQAELPGEFGPLESPRYFNLDLPGGLKGRGIGLRFVPRREHPERQPSVEASPPSEVGLVLAVSRDHLNHALSSMGAVMLLAGALTLLATAVFVTFVLRKGLAPLRHLADQAASIDANSLETRFPTHGLPSELDPICSRLNDLLARLERSFENLDEYAAKVAHELRTPLAILRLKVEQADGLLPPDLAEELQIELHQLAHVVDQSLLIAKAEQGRLAVQPREFDLAALVADVAEDFELLAQDGGRRVRFEKAAACDVTADPKHARQIIHNLLTNALKHGRGDIRVKLAPRRQACSLTIFNPVRHEATPMEETLGLGLRVVDTLLHLQPELKYGRRRGKQYYAVRMMFPAATSALGGPVMATTAQARACV